VLIKDFSAPDAIRLFTEERVSHSFLAPAMIQMMLQEPAAAGGDYSRLRSIAYGASPIAEDVLRRARATFGCGFVQFYGMTESTGGGSYLSPSAHDLPGKLTSCGKPWPDTAMAILDGQGNELGDGEIGEIAIRGALAMKQYWNRPDATEEALAGGWLHTGDVGYRDADGFYFVHDRIKDMIVSGGENVYAAEVERVLARHPAVRECAVIGIASDRWGEAVHALVRLKPGAAADEAGVIAFCREHLSAYKSPRSVEFTADPFPLTGAGKIDKRSLRQARRG